MIGASPQDGLPFNVGPITVSCPLKEDRETRRAVGMLLAAGMGKYCLTEGSQGETGKTRNTMATSRRPAISQRNPSCVDGNRLTNTPAQRRRSTTLMTVSYCIKGILEGEENHVNGGTEDSSMMCEKSKYACIPVL